MSSVYRKKTRTRKSKSNIKKSRTRNTRKNVNYLKKLQLEEELSRSIVKQTSAKTPVVSMGHGAKLLTKSKKQLRKGNVGNAMASLLTAVAVLSATGPFTPHPNVKQQRMTKQYEGRWTGDPDELMKWHMDEQFTPSLRQTTRRREKTIKKRESKPVKRLSKTKKANKRKVVRR